MKVSWTCRCGLKGQVRVKRGEQFIAEICRQHTDAAGQSFTEKYFHIEISEDAEPRVLLKHVQ